MLSGRLVYILPRHHTLTTSVHVVTCFIRTLAQDSLLLHIQRQTLSGTLQWDSLLVQRVKAGIEAKAHRTLPQDPRLGHIERQALVSGKPSQYPRLIHIEKHTVCGTLPQDPRILPIEKQTLSGRLPQEYPLLLTERQTKLHLSSVKSAGCCRKVYPYYSSKMDLDSPQTPNFSGLKDFPMGLFKVSGPPRVRLYPMKDELPVLPEKGEFRDSGVFFSSVDSTPEPREADANFLDIGSDSTEGSESISVDEGKEVVCSPDLDFESSKDSSCNLHSFLSPFKADTLSLDGLSAGPPILDLTRLMMQPVRSSPAAKEQKKTVLPENLLNQVSNVVRAKVEAREDISGPIPTSEDDLGNLTPADSEDETRLDLPKVPHDEDSLLQCELIEDDTLHQSKKSRNRAKKRKGASTADGNSSKKEKKVAPNYFVAVQIKNQEVHRHIEKVQQHVAAINSCLSAAFIPTPTLHLSLHVSHLPDDDHITRAKAAMAECQERVSSLWAGGHSPLLHVMGLGAFRDNVVFAKLEESQDSKQLKEVADVVNECFMNNGIASTDDRGFKPHITVMKLSKAPRLRHKGIKKIEPSLYEAFSSCEYGWQRVLGLQLCAMAKPKDDQGYYHVEHEVTFDLPEGEPTDGGAGRTANFEPRLLVAKPLKTVVKLEKELKWAFHPPEEHT